MSMLMCVTLPSYDFCSFRSFTINSVYKLQFFLHLFMFIYVYNTKNCSLYTLFYYQF